MVERLPRSGGNVLGFRMSGRLHDLDYLQFVPVVEAAVAEYGKVRLLAQFHDFHGWDPHALWDDIKFSSKHCHDVDRIALVGDKQWEYWMSSICKPFTKAAVRYFDVSEEEQAWAWLEEELGMRDPVAHANAQIRRTNTMLHNPTASRAADGGDAR